MPVPAQPARAGRAGARHRHPREAVARPVSRVRETLDALAARPSLLPLAATAPLPSWQVRVLWQQLRPAVERELATRRPDLVLVEIDAGGWLGDLPGDIPVLLSMHDVAWLPRRPRRRHQQPPGGALARRRAGARLARPAPLAAALRRTRLRLQADAALLQQGSTPPRRRSTWSPAASTWPPSAGRAGIPGPPSLLFTGTMNATSNVEGIGWISRARSGRVREQVPAARLVVVGRDPSETVRRLDALDGVTVTGGVRTWRRTSRRQRRRRAAAVGRRNAPEDRRAAASGLVCRPRGAEGSSARQARAGAGRRRGVVRAATVALLGDAERRAELAAAARVFAERQDWRALGDRFERAALQAAGRDAT